MKKITEVDEPLTPAGRLFAQPELNQIIHCVIGGKNPLDIEALKAEISSSAMLKQPRFNSLLVYDSTGKEHWRRTQVNLDDHIIIRHQPLTQDPLISEDDAVNDYIADLSVSSPLSLDKPLWEIHFLMAHRCAVIRLHHALGDGISLMSMLLTSCRKAADPAQFATIGGVKASSSLSKRRNLWRNLWRVILVVWYTLVFVLEFVMRAVWLKDKRTALSGGDGVELWPRQLVTAKFSVDDMKTVKNAVLNATLNDVLMGMISCGLSRYLDIRSPKVMQEGLQITGVAMVNLRHLNGPQDFTKLSNDNCEGNRFGNQFGIILIPLTYHKPNDDILQYVKRAKSMIDKKKLSLEANFAYRLVAMTMSFFGAKIYSRGEYIALGDDQRFASQLNYRVMCNTTFTMSNLIGPYEEITITGNPVTYLRVSNTSLPHALTMQMVSYAGRADMQILVAKDIIPDPKVLAKCLEDSLLDMKKAALAART